MLRRDHEVIVVRHPAKASIKANHAVVEEARSACLSLHRQESCFQQSMHKRETYRLYDVVDRDAQIFCLFISIGVVLVLSFEEYEHSYLQDELN